MSDLDPIPSSDPRLAGNWHPFPPPDKGTYDLRQAVQGPDGDSQQYFFFLPNKRVVEQQQGRLYCLGRRVTRMRPEQGWQFRFRPEAQKGVPTRYRPFAVIYRTDADGIMSMVRKDDVSQQLPVAVSREEALYIVRQMPDRWPVFCKIHVEYTPEQLTS